MRITLLALGFAILLGAHANGQNLDCNRPAGELSPADRRHCEQFERFLKTVPGDPSIHKGTEPRTNVREAEHYQDPGAISLCPPPYRMTEEFGCQAPRFFRAERR